MQKQTKSVRKWIEEQSKKGNNTFSIEQVRENFTHLNKQSIATALNRLTNENKILSVLKGFYVINSNVEMEITPYLYIDKLMNYLERKYYIGLSSASVFYGAKDICSKTFMVITELPPLRDTQKAEIITKYIIKRDIKEDYIISKEIGGYKVEISTPIVTAMDLVLYEKEIGGMAYVFQILKEIHTEIHLETVPFSLLYQFPVTVVQRLGYLFSLLENKQYAELWYEKAKEAGLSFRKTTLQTYTPTTDNDVFNPIWKIIINENINLK